MCQAEPRLAGQTPKLLLGTQTLVPSQSPVTASEEPQRLRAFLTTMPHLMAGPPCLLSHPTPPGALRVGGWGTQAAPH